jgi:hypothetical protein
MVRVMVNEALSVAAGQLLLLLSSLSFSAARYNCNKSMPTLPAASLPNYVSSVFPPPLCRQEHAEEQERRRARLPGLHAAGREPQRAPAAKRPQQLGSRGGGAGASALAAGPRRGGVPLVATIK